MRAIVVIEGREAIPVRALPFVTGGTMAPDSVANALARTTHFDRLEDIKAYHLSADGVAPMLPKEWDGIEADLEVLTAKLKAIETVDQENYPTWRRESILLLPPACFVWRDEFDQAFHRAHSPYGCTSSDDEREGERDLIFNPYVPEALRAIVLEGFNTCGPTEKVVKGEAAALTDGERNKLLKQVAGLALALAEKSGRYKVGDRPNASQIAEAVSEVVGEMPGAKARGMGMSSIRESIRAGLDLLNS